MALSQEVDLTHRALVDPGTPAPVLGTLPRLSLNVDERGCRGIGNLTRPHLVTTSFALMSMGPSVRVSTHPSTSTASTDRVILFRLPVTRACVGERAFLEPRARPLAGPVDTACSALYDIEAEAKGSMPLHYNIIKVRTLFMRRQDKN